VADFSYKAVKKRKKKRRGEEEGRKRGGRIDDLYMMYLRSRFFNVFKSAQESPILSRNRSGRPFLEQFRDPPIELKSYWWKRTE
jgi:hypothetical protein